MTVADLPEQLFLYLPMVEDLKLTAQTFIMGFRSCRTVELSSCAG